MHSLKRLGICVLLVASGCSDDVGDENAAGATTQAEGTCVAAETIQGVKASLFEKVRAASEGNSSMFNEFEAGSVVSIEVPVVDQHEPQLRRTVCSGLLVLDLPPGSEGSFNGERQLVTEVRYSSQMAADGSGAVFAVFGAEPMAARIAQAVSARPMPGQIAPRSQISFNPSFECNSDNTVVEQAICASRDLSFRDREMATLYSERLNEVSFSGETEELQAGQRQFLRVRDACRDETCIAQAYLERAEILESWGI